VREQLLAEKLEQTGMSTGVTGLAKVELVPVPFTVRNWSTSCERALRQRLADCHSDAAYSKSQTQRRTCRALEYEIHRCDLPASSATSLRRPWTLAVAMVTLRVLERAGSKRTRVPSRKNLVPVTGGNSA